MVDGGILAPFVAFVAAAVIVVLHRRGTPTWLLIAVGLFCVYLWGVASETLFPIEFDTEQVRDPSGPWAVINLAPFNGVFDSRPGRMQALLNVVLGVPFGLLLPLLGVRSGGRVLALGLLFTLSIEGLQLVENRAYGRQYRTVDVNDVILNWLGVAIGLAAYLLVAAVVSRWPGRTRRGVPGRR